jgi:hypothetical protein
VLTFTDRLDSGAMVRLFVLCAISGLVLAMWPVAAVTALAICFSLFLVMQVPRPLYAIFMAFLVLQDPLRLIFHGDETTIGFLVKRSDDLAVLALGAWVLVSSRTAHRTLRAHGIGLAIAACYLPLLVSSGLEGVQTAPALLDLALFSKPFLLFAIGTSISLSPNLIARGLRPTLLLMLGVILFALVFIAFPALQEAYIGDIRQPDMRLGLVSAQGFFDGPGPYSWFCAATFAIAYAAYLAFGEKFYLYAASISGVFTFAAWRRKSILGIVAMVALAAFINGRLTSRNRMRAVVVVGLVAVLAVTVLAPYLAGLWDVTVAEYATDPYRIARFALHDAAVRIAIDHLPFGTGLASFGSHASRVYYSDVYYRYGLSKIWGLSPDFPEFITDTFWPMIIGEGGITGFLAYLGFFGILAIRFWRTARQADLTRAQRFLVLAAFFLLVGSLSESTSSHIYNSTMQSALVMIPMGICWSSVVARLDSGHGGPAAHSEERIVSERGVQ